MHHALLFNVERTNISRNLGPYRIAHWLRSQNWDVEVVDFALKWEFDQLTEFAKRKITKNTKFIGFSYQFGRWNETLEKFIIWLNTYYPDLVIISGSSMICDEDDLVDWHISGFGEYAIDHLLKYLFSNGPKPISYKHGAINLIKGIDYPAYPLNDYAVTYEERDFLQPWEFLSIETGRGCRFKCSFCNFSVLGIKEDHSTSVESFETQLRENYSRWGIKNYIITEETFNDNTFKLKKLASSMNNLDFDPWFSAFIRLDLLLARKDDRKYLEDIGVFGHLYGIESLHTPTAKIYKKGLASSKIKDGLLEVKEYFAKTGLYRGSTSFIIGGPHEPIESHYDTLDWLVNNWSDQNVTQYVLGIPIGNKVSLSEFSKNYRDYGYTEITYDELYKKYPNHEDLIQIIKDEKERRDILVWKNEHMNILDANIILNDWAEATKSFKINCFGMAAVTGRTHSIRDKLELNGSDRRAGKFLEVENAWHNEYIDKKMHS